MTTIAFPDGVPGFTEIKSFNLVRTRDDSVLMWLAGDGKHLPVVLPWAFDWEYEVKLDEEDLEGLDIDGPEDMIILCVVNIPEDVRRGTINKFAPVVINERTLTARQIVNKKSGYSTRDQLLAPGAAFPQAMHGLDIATTAQVVS